MVEVFVIRYMFMKSTICLLINFTPIFDAWLSTLVVIDTVVPVKI